MKKPITILYVDDNRLDRELVRDALEKEPGNFKVVEAASRAQFNKLIAKNDYDLVLSDFNILGFDGLQVLDIIRAQAPAAPVIIVTGTGSEEVAVEAMQRGAADYVIKTPSHIQHLPHTIQGVLGKMHLEVKRRQTEEELRRSRENLNNLFQFTTDAIFIQNRRREILDCNTAAEKLFGYSKAELVADSTIKLGDQEKTDDGQRVEYFQRAIKGQPQRFDWWGKRKDGVSFPEEITLNRTIYNGQEVVFITIRDITERQQAEAALTSHFEQTQKLHEFVEKLNRATTPKAAYSAAIRSMMTVLEADRASILLADPDGVVRFKAWKGLSVAYRKAVEEHFPWELSDVKAQPIFISDITDAGLTEKLEVTILEEGIHACTFVPLIGKGRLLGKFMTGYNQVHVFKPDEMNIARVLADNLATVVERFQSLETLKKSEERFHSLAQTATDAIITISAKGMIQFFNQAAERIFGYPVAEIIDRQVTLLIPDEYKAKHQAGIRRYLKTGKPAALGKTVELTGKRRDGRRFPIELSLSEVQTGKEKTFIAIIRDITARKQVEKALELTQFSVDKMMDAVYWIDPDARFISVNDAACKTLGYSRAELLTMSVYDIDPEFPPAAWPAHLQELRQKKSFVLESVHQKKDGSFFPVEIAANYIQFGDQEYNCAFARDITERKQAEEALQESEVRFRSLFENSTVGLYRTTPDGSILLANPILVQMLGYSSFEELRARNLEQEGFEPGYSRNDFKKRIEQAGQITGFESAWRTQAGAVIYIRESAKAIRDADGAVQYYEGTVEDVTERVQAEERLQMVARFSARSTGEGFFPALVQSMAKALNVKIVFAAELVSTEPARARALAIWIGEGFAENFDWLLAGKPCAEVVQGKTKYFIKDLQATFPDDHWLAEVGAESYLGVPITDNEGQVIGHVGFMDDKPLQEPQQIENLVGIFADRAGAELERVRAEERLQMVARFSARATGKDFFPALVQSMAKALNVKIVFAAELVSTEPARASILAIWIGEGLAENFEWLLSDTPCAEVVQGKIKCFPKSVQAAFPDDHWLVEVGAEGYLGLPITDNEGQVIGHIGVLDDKPLQEPQQIENLMGIFADRAGAELERKQAEKKLLKLSQSVEQSPASVVITDPDGAIEYVNPKFEQITGYSSDKIRGQNPRFLKSGVQSKEFYEDLWQVITSGREWHGEFCNKKKNGELFWESASISPLIDSDGTITHFVGVKEDITEKKQLEDQLRQAQKMESVGRLAGGIAHDFNNMLSIINGYSEMLLMEMSPETAPRTRTKITNIYEAGQQAATLTRQLLAYSRKQLLEVKVVNLNTVVQGTEKLLRQTIGENIELIFKPGKNLASVKIDPGQIEQVIMNLAINARDAMPHGGKLTLETHNITLDEAYAAEQLEVEAGEYVQLMLSDTGSGMDREIMDQIFEPFFTTKEFGAGTGLGLSTVFGIMKQSGGHITVYSEKGVGTTFKLYLPRVAAKPETNRKAPEPALVTGTETILLAEDDAGVRGVAQSSLEAAGYRVLAADNGATALEILKAEKQPVDLLFTDLMMPGMSGKELAEKAAGLASGLKVLFMSGYTDDIIADQGILEAGTHFIQKPFSPVDLTRKVREILDE